MKSLHKVIQTDQDPLFTNWVTLSELFNLSFSFVYKKE